MSWYHGVRYWKRPVIKKRQTTLSTLSEGQLIEGQSRISPIMGHFLDLGGIDGLLHITDISWGVLDILPTCFPLETELRYWFSNMTEKVGVSLWASNKRPRSLDQSRREISRRQSSAGKVVSLTDYGAFVELEPGVEGLVHVSEMSWTHEVRHPSRVVNVGDPIGGAGSSR